MKNLRALIRGAAIVGLVGSAACNDSSGSVPPTAADSHASEVVVPDTTVAETTAVAETTIAETTVAETTAAETTAVADTASETTASCSRQGFVAVAQDAHMYTADMGYLAQSTLGAPVDTLNIETYAALGGLTAAGMVTLQAGDYADCGNCVLAYVGCDANLDNCQKTFLAESGTLDIATWGAKGEHFSGTLTDVKLVEVTVDDQSHSTVVAGGETWCLANYAFDAIIQ